MGHSQDDRVLQKDQLWRIPSGCVFDFNGREIHGRQRAGWLERWHRIGDLLRCPMAGLVKNVESVLAINLASGGAAVRENGCIKAHEEI